MSSPVVSPLEVNTGGQYLVSIAVAEIATTWQALCNELSTWQAIVNNYSTWLQVKQR